MMPNYTFARDTEEIEVFCKIDEYDEMCESMKADGWQRVYTPLAIVGMVGSVLSRTDSGWKDVLKKIKKSSGKKNTINV